MNITLPSTRDPEDPSLGLGPVSLDLLKLRYLNRDEHGTVCESPLDMMKRVASNIASVDRRYDGDVVFAYEEFLHHLTNLHFVPASPILMNAGNKLQFLFSDHALDVPDSIEDIFEVLKLSASIQQRGGGLGFSFSKIRPFHDDVSGMKKVAFGPLNVMKIFDTSFHAILQGGRRNGANMAVLSISHPDILSFIEAKQDGGVLQNFNLSVALTDVFIDAVNADKPFDLVNPRTGAVVQTVSARSLFDAITEQAWKTGDPGLIFLDKMNCSYPFKEKKVLCTGACGQYELESFEGVPYAHINVSRMLAKAGGSFRLDTDLLKRTVKSAVHFLDNCIDAHEYIDSFFELQSKRTRKIGVGIMGFAELLFILGIPYGSHESLEIIDSIMSIVRDSSRQASHELAVSRGPFPLFDSSTWDRPMRNATITSIAPTGSTSLVAGTSQSIEPVFALSFTTMTSDGEEFTVLNNAFKDAIDALAIDQTAKIQLQFVDSVQNIEWLDTSFKNVFRTAMDIPPEDHLAVMSRFQEYIDNSISKTINLPNKASVDDVKQIMLKAHELGCKGITIYRDGCRGDQAVMTKRQTRLSAFNRFA